MKWVEPEKTWNAVWQTKVSCEMNYTHETILKKHNFKFIELFNIKFTLYTSIKVWSGITNTKLDAHSQTKFTCTNLNASGDVLTQAVPCIPKLK